MGSPFAPNEVPAPVCAAALTESRYHVRSLPPGIRSFLHRHRCTVPDLRADRAVFQQGCSVDRRSFPDIDLPDETGAGDACVRTDGTEGVAALCGVAFDHPFDGFDSLGAIAIDGQDVGGLGGDKLLKRVYKSTFFGIPVTRSPTPRGV